MTKRRDFIKVSALGLGAATIGLPVIRSFAKANIDLEKDKFSAFSRTPT